MGWGWESGGSNKISVRNLGHLSALVRVPSGEKRVIVSRIRWSFFFFPLSRNFQKQHRNCFRVKPPYGLAERLGMGLRSVSCCAFVIKHARTLYRLLTALITGNYRSAGPVGVPIPSKHPVSNMSSRSVHYGCRSVESLCARFGECGHSWALTKKSDKGFMSLMTHRALAFSYGSKVSTTQQEGWCFCLDLNKVVNTLYTFPSQSWIHRLQRVQNATARLITGRR